MDIHSFWQRVKFSMQKIRVVLVCDQVQRELSALKSLKKQLKEKLNSEVFIIGSLAEEQRILYLLHKIKPHIVFITQIQEGVTRRIAKYIKGSGGIVSILPVELSYSRSNLFWLFNKRLSYNQYLDFYFLPGIKMYKDIKNFTDISKSKLFIVGSPKMDLIVSKGNEFLKRSQFLSIHRIPKNRKNIFLYTTFFGSSENYIAKDIAFKGNVKATQRMFKAISDTKKAYLTIIIKLCSDFRDYNIILKPHPLEDSSDYKRIKEKNFYLIRDEIFNNTVKAVDLAIHWNSTVATECWLQGKKTLQYSPIRKYDDILSETVYGNPLLRTYDELESAIKTYISNNLERKYLTFQKEYIRKWYYRVDGKSGERIVNIIKKKMEFPEKLEYTAKFDKKVFVVYFLEKLIGVKLSRIIISLFVRDFRWEYAADNYLPEESM